MTHNKYLIAMGCMKGLRWWGRWMPGGGASRGKGNAPLTVILVSAMLFLLRVHLFLNQSLVI